MGNVKIMQMSFDEEDMKILKKVKGNKTWKHFFMDIANEKLEEMSSMQD